MQIMHDLGRKRYAYRLMKPARRGIPGSKTRSTGWRNTLEFAKLSGAFTELLDICP